MLIEAHYDLDNITERLESIEKQKQELNQDKETLLRLVTKILLSDEDYSDQFNKIKLELSKLESESKRLLNADKEIAEIEFKYKQFIDFLKQIDLDNLTNSKLRKVIKYIYVLSGYVVPGEGDNQHVRVIEWNFIEWSQQDIIDENVTMWMKKMEKLKAINELT